MTDNYLAPIVADAIYPLPDFMRRTGLAKAAIRAMRRTGLIVRRIGRRSYVLGSDFLNWVENQAEIVSLARQAHQNLEDVQPSQNQ